MADGDGTRTAGAELRVRSGDGTGGRVGARVGEFVGACDSVGAAGL